ncbi:MAG: hypothetical protein C4K49_10665 [Candidatus Thorarchaeota archaeon]|nr:MAG: hypothetical protein C4K49_10665 [Candidatus Thorarchaeota archaeon]
MRMIQFKSVQDDGTVKIVGTAKLVDGKVVIVTSKSGLKTRLKTDEIIGLDNKAKTPENGIDWLEALPYNYHGSRFFAEEVEVK